MLLPPLYLRLLFFLLLLPLLLLLSFLLLQRKRKALEFLPKGHFIRVEEDMIAYKQQQEQRDAAAAASAEAAAEAKREKTPREKLDADIPDFARIWVRRLCYRRDAVVAAPFIVAFVFCC